MPLSESAQAIVKRTIIIQQDHRATSFCIVARSATALHRFARERVRV